MARDLSCPSGKQAFRTKRDAEAANPGAPVRRCDRCRWWHVDAKAKVRRLVQRAEGGPVVRRERWRKGSK